MTNKDYAEIQRRLGFIEGLIADANSTIVYDCVTSAINEIDEILKKEMFDRPAVKMMKSGVE